MQFQNVFGHLLKAVTFAAAVGIVVLAVSIYGYSLWKIVGVMQLILEGAKEEYIIQKALKAIDLVLLGVIFFIIGMGLFELFIKPIDNLPSWFHIENIDQLKALLIKVIIVVMGVSFTGRVVIWNGSVDLLRLGVGMAVVIGVLSYFLTVKSKS